MDSKLPFINLKMLLLKIAKNKEPRDEEGQTPCHVAAKHGQLEAIQYLASVTDITPKDKEGE